MILPTRTATNRAGRSIANTCITDFRRSVVRLGLQHYNELAARLDAALTTQLATGSTDGHLAWLVPLLKEYYDPMYRYQLEKKAEKVVFRGEWADGGMG